MSKHSLAAGFVLQWLDDKGRARWELNRPAEEEKREGEKKKWGERATGWREEWSMTDLGSEWEWGEGNWEGRKKGEKKKKKEGRLDKKWKFSPEEE